jgi:hypothetical protein
MACERQIDARREPSLKMSLSLKHFRTNKLRSDANTMRRQPGISIVLSAFFSFVSFFACGQATAQWLPRNPYSGKKLEIHLAGTN